MQPRIHPLEVAPDTEIGEELAKMMPPGIPPLYLFKTFAVNPRIMRKFQGGNLLDRGSLTLRQREIVIDRVTAQCGSEYEWGVHVAFFAEKVKLSQAQIQSLTFGDASDAVWEDESEKILIQLTDETLATKQISEELWAKVKQHFSDEQVLELLALIGYYHTISLITNGLRIELEKFAPRFANYKR
ncbi:MAG: carboxymuconolactone decarboxylase family protein [Microscillaceae bacterium]|jgi:alkylhydroperoxidase family enzyme|nr:carboxymuconolactone decarboxylase family protein [Microscillaceae bacterium]